MNRMRLWVSAGIIACVILVLFALSVPHTRDVPLRSKTEGVASSTPVVALRDTFKKGVHTISGSLMVPNACTPVRASLSPVEGASSTVGIALDLTYTIESGICLQVPTSVAFQSTVTAPASVPIQVTVNGAVASTTPL